MGDALRALVTREQLDVLSPGALDLGPGRPPTTRPERDSPRLLAGPPLAAPPEPPHPADVDAADVVPHSRRTPAAATSRWSFGRPTSHRAARSTPASCAPCWRSC
ncbi:hypothetical protein ACL03H_04180 [Saccharopolyspora sp. MS10]|uniref:hypothetical protein n=1 Tax=Saccharopolyspora sp. MS10 TaxID=3385973 RepID=UPI0039A24DFF